MNTEVVQDVVTGFYATTTSEWVTQIIKLLDDGDLRAKQGAAARYKVMRHYCLANYGDTIAHYIRQAVEEPRHR